MKDNMKVLFKNQCTYTRKYYRELKFKTLDSGFVTTGIIFLIFAVAILGFALLKGMTVLAITAGVFCLFLLYRLIGTPIRLANFAATKNRQIYERDVETLNTFYEDHVLAVNLLSNGLTNIKYVDVKRLLKTKNMYIIEMDQGFVLMIDKHGFIEGTEVDFVEFIKEKCINAEVKI